MVELVYNHRYKGKSIGLVTQSPRNRRNNKETLFKRINTVRRLKRLEKLFPKNKNTTKVVAGGRHTEITKTPLTELSNRIKVI